MSFIRYSDGTAERCDTCNCDAGYGFFVGVTPVHELRGPREEAFLCSGCALPSMRPRMTSRRPPGTAPSRAGSTTSSSLGRYATRGTDGPWLRATGPR
jgi:hypothetical protein